MDCGEYGLNMRLDIGLSKGSLDGDAQFLWFDRVGQVLRGVHGPISEPSVTDSPRESSRRQQSCLGIVSSGVTDIEDGYGTERQII